MKGKPVCFAISVTVIGLLAVLAVAPARTAELAAEFLRWSDGEEPDVSKVFIKGDLRREEILDEGEVGTISITRPDEGVVWNLMPDEKMYMVVPLIEDASVTILNVDGLDAHGKVKVLGTEEVSGFECEVREYSLEDSGRGVAKVWYATALEFPIRIVQRIDSEQFTMEYRKIEVGPVPDSMFEVPPGYTQLEIPGMDQLPEGMPGFPGGE
jgi:hypothetical protein